MGGEIVNTKNYLEPDRRWSIWGCNTMEEYLSKYLIPSKFHSDVPESIVQSYHIVERLIAYSYFHYPLVEEAVSKMTRIFEMALKQKAKSLNIKAWSLSGIIDKLLTNEDTEPEMAELWHGIKDIRNYYAHLDNISYSGPEPLKILYPIINSINSLFCLEKLFQRANQNLNKFQSCFKQFVDGIFILEYGEVIRLVISARPYFISPGSLTSLWIFIPVYVEFPQSMEEYSIQNPIIMRLSDISLNDSMLIGKEFLNDKVIKLYPTQIEGNLTAAKSYKKKIESSNSEVRALHEESRMELSFHEKHKFIYDEFWKF